MELEGIRVGSFDTLPRAVISESPLDQLRLDQGMTTATEAGNGLVGKPGMKWLVVDECHTVLEVY